MIRNLLPSTVESFFLFELLLIAVEEEVFL